MATIFKIRRDTASNWSTNNPTLAQGEMGLDLTNNFIKMGDGSTAWNGLGQFTQNIENVEDLVGAMVTSNTETFISVTYDDSDGSLDFVVPVLDEDNLASDSVGHLATQQSIKAYVDATAAALDTAQDLDFQGDSGGALSIDLDAEVLDIAGGTGIDTVGSSNTLTVAIDSTVTTLTGSQTLTNKSLTSPAVTGNVSGDAFLDEDNMASNSSTKLASQQSIKAYVDASVTAQDLDFIADSGGALSIDLDSESLTIAGGTGITSVGSGNGVTLNIDSTVATLTGTQTMSAKTLTSPVINTGVSGSAILDSDTMSGTSATTLASSESIKAYVDSQVTAQDLDFQGDSGGALAIDLDSESLTIAGGTGITTVGSSNTVTASIDATVATLADTQTFTNKTLTSPTVTSAVLNTSVSGSAFLDEDNMASNSATKLASQQSIKAYVDAQVDTEDTLAELDDITITSAADGSLLLYDTGNSVWIDNVMSGDATLADTGVITFATVNSDVGQAGSATAIPIVTVNAKGLVTAVSTASIVTQLTVGADTGSNDAVALASDVLDFTGGTGIDTTVSDNDISIAIDSTVATLAGTQTFTNKTLTTPTITSATLNTGVSGSAFLDEDNMASDSATKLASQQSIKAYVDATVTAQDLDIAGDSGTGAIDLDSESLTIAGTANEIETSMSGNTLTVGLPTNVTIAGNLTVSGTQTTVSSTTVTVADPMLSLATNNGSADAVDIGLYGLYDTSGSQDLYGGIFRDASDSGKWKLYKDSQSEPTTTVNVGATGHAVGTLVANLEGNVTGNVIGNLTGNVTGNTSGTALTVTQAAQPAITSTGTLTALQVDNININGNTISTTGGTDLNIGPVAGQQIVLDGTIEIDGGVVTGATSITSTNFVGDLTGSVTGASSLNLLKSGGAMTGAITTSSTFDGRDVGTDGTKLDTIETNADVTDATNVNAAGALMLSDTTTAGLGIVIDEDDLSSDLATKVPTQQSVKAYVDSQVTAQDLDLTTDSGTIAIDLDSETLSILGGTGLSSSATGNAATISIDSTVTTLTGSQTLTNKTLTAPTLTSPVFNTGVSGSAIKDEDNMASNSATHLATQQSIKAYVDGQTTDETAEGSSNLYFTGERVDDRVNTLIVGGTNVTATYDDASNRLTISAAEGASGYNLQSNDTDDLSEGSSNLYFTNSRADARIVNALKDEDNMASNSATHAPSQQSVKAYVDDQIGAENTLAEDNDVNITSAADGSLLLYDTGTAKWIDNVMSGDATLADTGVVTLATVNSNTGSIGSSTAIPVITTNAKGLVTAVSTASITTALSVGADSGTNDSVALASDVLDFTGGTGIDTTVSNNDISIAIDSTVATLTGTQTLTNKTINSPVLNTAVTGSAILDEDSMSSNSNTKLATQQSIKAYVDGSITTLIGGAPSTLNDLNELAAAINDDSNYNTTLVTALATKLPLAGGAMTGAITTNSTFDGVDVGVRDGVLTTTTNTANAALPKSGGAMTGAITTNSLIDGRNLFQDGNKLDAIEASADVTDAANVESAGAVMESGNTGAAKIPAGTTAQRDASPSVGYFRWNTTIPRAEIYDGTEWSLVGGGNTTKKALWEHSYTVAENYEMTSGNNALTAGPITINSGFSVTVPSGSTWAIV
jgi:hypothetical protein